MKTNHMKNEFSRSDNLIIGRNPVMEALNAGKNIDYILTSEKTVRGSLIPIVNKAKNLGIQIKKVAQQKLDSLSGKIPHQGVIAVGCVKNYCTLEGILNCAAQKNEPPFIVIADGIEDPHNLGAIIRTAECAGVHGVIIPKRRSVGLTPTVDKASAGALEHMLIARETNIPSVIEKLKNLNIWVYAAEAGGQIWCKQNLMGPIALVVGSEGKGVSRIAKEKCDGIISLPMFGKVNSLNVSAASAVILYEIVRQRSKL